jgi:hypothetical protein
MHASSFRSLICTGLLVLPRAAAAQSDSIPHRSSAPNNCAHVQIAGVGVQDVLASVGIAVLDEPLEEGVGGSLWLEAPIRSAQLGELVVDSMWLDLGGQTLGFAMRPWDNPPLKEDSLAHAWRVFAFSKSWKHFGIRGHDWLLKLTRDLEAEGVLRFRVSSGRSTGYIRATKCNPTMIG